MHSSTLIAPRRAAALCALVLAAACADQPTAPAARAGAGAPSLATSPSGARLISNTVKYADTGKKPSTGRAGSAAITALALRGSDGVTELEVTAAPADPASPAQASIQKVKTRATDANGGQVFEVSHNGLSGARTVQRYTGLGWGASLAVQANVTGIDPARTDVVEAVAPVLLRPDLRVYMWGQQSLVRDGAPLAISAYLAEANGQVGARADCVLYVDGAAVDRAAGVWVDAGGFVTCAFTHTFSGGGTQHQVEVRAENVSPRDYDAANNAAAVTVQVIAADNHYSGAYAASVGYTTQSSWSSLWQNRLTGDEGETRGVFNFANEQQYGSAYGSLEAGLAAPFTVHASQTTGGTTVNAVTWQVDELPGCASHFDGAQGVFLYVCTWMQQTTFRYDRATGSVTYHSSDYQRQWDGATGTEYVYNYNYDYSHTSGPVVPFGADYTFRMSFVTADTTIPSNVTFPLATEQTGYENPETCHQSDSADYFARSCSQYRSVNHGTRGGWPTP